MGDAWMEDNFEDIFSRIGMRPFEVFYHVVELGGFSEAASKMNLSQPTVSQHVKNLEETLGETLILRDGTDLSLTPVGEICYRKMTELQAIKNDLEEELQSHREASQGDLTIGASTIPGEFLLPRVLPDFRDQHRKGTIQIDIDESSSILERLEDGDLRWGVTGREPTSSALNSSAIIVDKMRLVESSTPETGKETITLEELTRQPYVGRGARSGTRIAVETFLSNQGMDPEDDLNTVARLGTVQSVREAVINGLGIAFLPESVVQRDLRSGRLKIIETEFEPIERTFYGVENRFLGVPPSIDAFRTFLREFSDLKVAE
ncbi:MAG: LysR substrate-binding domain-containing protein [bacterium]